MKVDKNKKWWESEKKENPDYIDHIYVTKKEVTSAQLLDTNGNEIETFIHMGIEQYKINGKWHNGYRTTNAEGKTVIRWGDNNELEYTYGTIYEFNGKGTSYFSEVEFNKGLDKYGQKRSELTSVSDSLSTIRTQIDSLKSASEVVSESISASTSVKDASTSASNSTLLSETESNQQNSARSESLSESASTSKAQSDARSESLSASDVASESEKVRASASTSDSIAASESDKEVQQHLRRIARLQARALPKVQVRHAA